MRLGNSAACWSLCHQRISRIQSNPYSIYFGSSLKEYLSWKNGLKGATYVAINGPKSNIQTMVCHRSSENMGKSSPARSQDCGFVFQRSCKLKSCCSARIYIRRNGSGDINVDHRDTFRAQAQGGRRAVVFEAVARCCSANQRAG